MMTQLSLFPLPGAIKGPLPSDVQNEASRLFAELWTVVVESAEGQSAGEGDADE
jgi:hypothetical protein